VIDDNKFTPRDAERPYAQAARLYRKRGWTNPLPVGLVEGDDKKWRWLPGRKDAPPGGFTGAAGQECTDEIIDDWRNHRFKGATNIGVRLDQVVGFDIDGPEGQFVLHEYAEQIGALPATFSSTSRGALGTRRIHFYRVPPDLNVHGAEHMLRRLHGVETTDGQRILPLDIIHAGYRYAVVYPSVHPSGEQYRWYTPGRQVCGVPAVADLAEMPGAWQQLLHELGTEHRGTRGKPAARGAEFEAERGYTMHAAERSIETALGHIRTHPADGAGYNGQLFKRAHFLFMFAPIFWTEDAAQLAIEQALTIRFGAPDNDDHKTVASARSAVVEYFALLPDSADLTGYEFEDE
jgi:hypothetical protein